MDTVNALAVPESTPNAVTRRVEHGVATYDGEAVDRIILSNQRGMVVSCLSFGGIIERIIVPDRSGVGDDVVMGFDDIEDYFTDRCYFGALIGRYANRIGGARFHLDGKTYHLDPNDGANHLHGGAYGFHARVWSVSLLSESAGGGVQLTLRSPEGDGGYPGALTASVTYTLTESNELIVDYEAVTDRATPFSATQHSYFNLAGASRDVLEHELTIPASHFTPVTADLIPTGELRLVDGTPFDFRTPQRIGARIASHDEQLMRGEGYDHNFVLDTSDDRGPRLAARLYDPVSGRRLDVLTTEPGLQLCTGNALHRGVRGKHGVTYADHGGVALETQHFPDAPNQPGFPSAILRPGEHFHSRTIFQFSVDGR